VPLVVHWDGKMLVNSTDRKDLKSIVERHAIVVTGCFSFHYFKLKF
jgi:hypothetical protein